MAARKQLRQGPRPLPLHLATALLTCASSESAWRLWSSGSSGWSAPPSPRRARASRARGKPEKLADAAIGDLNAALATARTAMAPLLAEIDQALDRQHGENASAGERTEAFAAALRREAMRRLDRLMRGMQAYRGSPLRRNCIEAPTAWEEGSTQLLDYAPFSGRERHDELLPVLLVPSLVNRWQVLDLSPERSLVRAMARQGLRPFLVDWGSPGEIERGFDCSRYVARLQRALAFIRSYTGRKPAVLGYCMGGTLAVALARLQPQDIAALIAMAAPWDFHADRSGQSFIEAFGPALARLADSTGELSADIQNMLFWSLDPWQVGRKFERFSNADPDSSATRDFILLEDWLNEGAALAGPVARECLIDWYGRNLTGRGRWKVVGKLVRPRDIDLRALVLIPSGDRIVPPLSAAALCGSAGLPRAERRDLPLGHIGMVTSNRAPELCWQPMIAWLTRHLGSRS